MRACAIRYMLALIYRASHALAWLGNCVGGVIIVGLLLAVYVDGHLVSAGSTAPSRVRGGHLEVVSLYRCVRPPGLCDLKLTWNKEDRHKAI
jgi:hypothetical protein